MENNKKSPIPLLIGLLVVASSVVAGAVGIITNKKSESDKDDIDEPVSTTTPTPAPSITTSLTITPEKVSKYKNGTYSATGSYSTPEGTESILIAVKLEDDVITDLEVTKNAKSRESKTYQSFFADGAEGLVEGKNIDQVNLSQINGSSLTPIGFNKALNTIKSNAL